MVTVAFWLILLQANAPTGEAPAPADRIQVITPALPSATVQHAAGASVTVWLVEPGAELRVQVQGPGTVAITLRQLLPAAAVIADRATFGLTVDDSAVRDIDVVGRPARGTVSTDRPELRLSVPRHVLQPIEPGPHTLGLVAPTAGAGVAVELDWRDTIVPAGTPAPTAPVADAVPTEGTATAPEAPPPTPPPDAPTFAAVTVEDRLTGDNVQFYRVAENEPYVVNVAQPGVVTLRLHPLVAVDPFSVSESAPYSVVILENGRVLQQVGGSTRPSNDWRFAGSGAPKELALAEPREYRLSVTAAPRQLGVQIRRAPHGMIVRASFDASEDQAKLDADDDTATPARPTAVLEVDVSERARRDGGGILGGAVAIGTHLPSAGGVPGLWASARLAAGISLLRARYAVGVQAMVLRHSMTTDTAVPFVVPIHLSSSVLAVPLLGTVSARHPLGLPGWAVLGRVGAGACYLYASRSALGSEATASRWRWALAGAVGPAMHLGAGWLTLEAGYLWVPTTDLGILRDYTPRATTLAVGYSLGI